MFNLFQEAFSRFTGIYCTVCPFSRATLELSKALSSLRRCPLMTWIWRRRVVLSRVPSLKTRLGACLSTPKRCLEQVPRKTYSSLSRRVPLMLIAFGADVENWILYLCDLVWHCSFKTHQARARLMFFFWSLCGRDFFSCILCERWLWHTKVPTSSAAPEEVLPGRCSQCQDANHQRLWHAQPPGQGIAINGTCQRFMCILYIYMLFRTFPSSSSWWPCKEAAMKRQL